MPLYAEVRLPDGNVHFFTGEPFNPFSAAVVPYRRALQVTTASSTLPNLVLPETIPPGTYTFFAGLVRPGQPPTLVNLVGAVAQVDVTGGIGWSGRPCARAPGA